LVKVREPTQQRPAQKHSRTEGQFQQTKARFGKGVIGRFMMRSQANGLGEGSGDLLTVLRHMPDLPRTEPEFQYQHREQRQRKREVKSNKCLTRQSTMIFS